VVANQPGSLFWGHYPPLRLRPQQPNSYPSVLTKTDLTGDAAALQLRLRELNPVAPLIEVTHGAVELSALFDRHGRADVNRWLGDHAFEELEGGAGHGHPHHDTAIRSFCITRDEPLPVAAFEWWMTVFAQIDGPDLLRAKGIVNLAELDQPTGVYWVQHTMHPPVVPTGVADERPAHADGVRHARDRGGGGRGGARPGAGRVRGQAACASGTQGLLRRRLRFVGR